MDAFMTITSTVFSELVVVLSIYDIVHLFLEAKCVFHTLRKMNEFRRFKLVLLLEIQDRPQGEGQVLEDALKVATADGIFDFLDSPPTIRVDWVDHYGWMPVPIYPERF